MTVSLNKIFGNYQWIRFEKVALSLVSFFLIVFFEVFQGGTNYFNWLFNFLFCNNERGGKSDRRVVCCLCQQAVLDKDFCEVVSIDVQVALKFDSHEKASPSNILKEALVQFLKFFQEKGPLLRRVLDHTFLY